MKKSKQDLVLEYLTSEFNTYEEPDKYIDAMLSISSSSSTLGSEVTSLLSSLNDMQRSRLNSLQKELKNGLSDAEKPFGSLSNETLQSDFLLYSPKDTQTQEIKLFLEKLALVSRSNIEAEKAQYIRELKTQMKAFELDGIKIKNYITTKEEKNVWNMLLFSDPNKMDRHELEDILLKMKLAVGKHDKRLKETKDYFKKIDEVESRFAKVTGSYIEPAQYQRVKDHYHKELYPLKKPNTKEIVKEVSKIKEYLENKLEKLPQYLNDEQKAIMSDFLPMLHEYYEDQCSAFVYGKNYLPMARDLEEFHKSVEKMTVAEFLQSSDKLGFTMQHLYLLHWVGEELFKNFKKENLTLGKSVKKRIGWHEYKKKVAMAQRYSNFFQGVVFRNNVAHNGIIWEPKGFEDAIKRYKKGISLLGEDFNKLLENENMPKRHEVQLSKKEKIAIDRELLKKEELLKKDKFSQKYFDTSYNKVEIALGKYNTRFGLLNTENENDKPARNTLYYLFKMFEENGSMLDEMPKINKINELIRKEYDV